MSKRVLVVGPGALGVLVAVRLQNAGGEVVAAVRDAEAASRMPLAWEAIDPEGAVETASVPTVVEPEAAGPFDVLILATKCDDAGPALERWLPTLTPEGAVVALQNGIIGDDLAKQAADRLVECTVAFPATLLGPGRSEQTARGTFIIGPWPDGRMETATPLDAVAGIMAEVETTLIHRNMQGVKWTKLCLNSGITGLGALTGKTLGELMESRVARTALLHILSEGYRAGLAHGVVFEKVAGFHPRMVAVTKPSRVGLAARHVLLKLFGRRFRRQRSSSLQSLERGRRTEVHHLNGFLVDAAAAVGLDAPVNAAVLKLVQSIEAGDAAPAVSHLDALPFRFH